MFDKEDSFPDVIFVIPGIEKPLLFHRGILASSSVTFCSLFQDETNPFGAYDAANKCVNWMDGTNKDKTYPEVIVKWLRFCHGEDQSFSFDECPSALAALCHLQLTCRDAIQKMIIDHMIDTARKDAEAGSVMLKKCALGFRECHDNATGRVDIALAKVVLTGENITTRYDSVVNDCLMQIPALYLDIATYGYDHSEFGEFNIRMRYVKYHRSSISDEDKKVIMQRCDESKLDLAEVQELKKMGMVSETELSAAVFRALEQKESANGLEAYRLFSKK